MFNWFRKNNSNSKNINFAEIDSKDKALELLQEGGLEAIYLFPVEFGGHEVEFNQVFIPAFAKELKENFDVNAANLLEDGLVSNYSAEPIYKGDSFIPSKLILETKGETILKETIEIW